VLLGYECLLSDRTDAERAASPAARHQRASHGCGAAPAHAAAGVGARVVHVPLPDPGAAAAVGAEEVLAEGPVRVHQRAVAAPCRREPPVPLQRAQPHHAPGRVVRGQEAGSQAHRAPLLAEPRGVGGAGEEEERGGGRGHEGEAAARRHYCTQSALPQV
jgi:hypothetical protein